MCFADFRIFVFFWRGGRGQRKNLDKKDGDYGMVMGIGLEMLGVDKNVVYSGKRP